jgi:predicted deacylase
MTLRSLFLAAALLPTSAWPAAPDPGLAFIDTSFENASPLWYEQAADGSIVVNLIYDHERNSPNRAAGHVHFLLHARPGAKLTLEFKNLDIVRVGDPQAPHRVFIRARAHPRESAGNWVVQGLIRRLLKEPRRYCVYILPMANKDGVARGMTRFNLLGKDLNRHWDKPADPQLAPENAALEKWLDAMIQAGRRPHLAMDLHNDGSGKLHISRPSVPGLEQHLERMVRLEEMLRQHTWFTEGSTKAAFRNPGSLGDGWLERFGIDAVVHEFNCHWIAKLNEHPLGRHWENYGESLATAFAEYFRALNP